jgi:hypothetical protein
VGSVNLFLESETDLHADLPIGDLSFLQVQLHRLVVQHRGRLTNGRRGVRSPGAAAVPSGSARDMICSSRSRSSGRQPSLNGSRVAPVSSTQTDFTSVYSLSASMPFSRPKPLAPKPPNGAFGASTR